MEGNCKDANASVISFHQVLWHKHKNKNKKLAITVFLPELVPRENFHSNSILASGTKCPVQLSSEKSDLSKSIKNRAVLQIYHKGVAIKLDCSPLQISISGDFFFRLIVFLMDAQCCFLTFIMSKPIYKSVNSTYQGPFTQAVISFALVGYLC